MKINSLLRSSVLPLLFLCAHSAFATTPIDKNNPQHVRAEAFVNLPLVQVRALVPTQTPLLSTHGTWGFSLPFSWQDGDAHQLAELTHSAARCPNCSGTTMLWDVSDPQVMSCASCATELPTDVPYNSTFDASTWDGASLYPAYVAQKVTISFYQAPGGTNDNYYFDGLIQSFKNFYLKQAIDDCAATYTATEDSRFAQRIADVLVHYANSIPTWAPRLKTGLTVGAEVNELYPTFQSFDHKLNYSFLGDDRLPHNAWADPFVKVRTDAALDQIVSGSSLSYRDYISEHFYRYLTQFYVAQPIESIHLGNVGIEPLHMSTSYDRFSFPESAHWLIDYFKAMYERYKWGYDGMSIEGPSYHYLWASAMTFIRHAQGHVDPPGYVYPPTGNSFTNGVNLYDYAYKGERQRAIDYGGLTMSLPDGSRAGVHDCTRTLNLTQGGWYKLGKAPDESKSFILPSFVHTILGDGFGAQKVQTQMSASAASSGHTAQDTLMMQFYAKGKALLEFAGHQDYSNDTIMKNTAVVNHIGQNKYRSDITGKVDFFNSTMPGIKAMRTEADSLTFDRRNIDRYCRTIIQNTVDAERPYLVDLFEIAGGGWHEYKMGGNLFFPQHASANISLTAIPGDTPYYQAGDSSYWKRFSNVREGLIQTNSFVDFSFDAHPQQAALRMHFAPLHAGDTLQLSRMLTDTDRNKAEQQPDRPHLIIRRGSRAEMDNGKDDLYSTFIVVHEAYDGSAKITSVESEELGNGAIMVRVHMQDRTDTYLISKSSQPQQMSWNDYEADAIVAAFSENAGSNKQDLWMIGGRLARHDKRALVADEGVCEGQLLDIERERENAVSDALVTDLALPIGKTLSGQIICVDGYNDAGERTLVNAYVIDEVLLGQGAQRKIKVRQEPGLRLGGDGSIEEIYFPNKKAASHRLRFVSCSTSVPHIVAVTPEAEHWRHEGVMMNDGRAFDQSVAPHVFTVPADAPVRYRTDGQNPDANSALLPSGLTLTDDRFFYLSTSNSEGLTIPPVRKERYYKSKRALSGSPTVVRNGLDYTHSYHGPHSGTISNLQGNANLELLDSVARGIQFTIDGYLKAPTSGYYRFYVMGSSSIDLQIDGERIFHQVGNEMVGNWHTEIYLEAGWHRLNILYGTGAHRWLNVEWSGPGFDLEPIPADHFAAELSGITDNVTLTYQSTVGGQLVGNDLQQLTPNDNGTPVTAVADPGYRFVGWSDGTMTPIHQQFSVQSSASFTAIFEQTPVTLSYSAGNHGALSGLLSQRLLPGQTGSAVTAVAQQGYVFQQWSDGVMSATRTDQALSNDLTVSALFIVDTVAPVIVSLTGPTQAFDYLQPAHFSVEATDNGTAQEDLLIEWDLDADGEYDDATGRDVSYIYPLSLTGSLNVGVRVTDYAGNSTTASHFLTVVAYAGAYLSDMSWESAVSGAGSVKRDVSSSGAPLTLNGVVYPKGLGTHANSTIIYNLAGAYATFESVVGINDNASGSATFIVYLDGVEAYRSSELTRSTGPEEISLDITGVQELKLVVDGGASTSSDHADWAMARVLLGGIDVAAPVISSLTVPQRVGFQEVFTASVTATDDATDANALVFAWDLDGDGQFDDAQGSVVPWSYDVPTARTVAIGVEVRDGAGRTTTQQAVIEIVAPSFIYLSDMDWDPALSENGGRSDWKIQKDQSTDKSPLILNGVKYERGLGMNADGRIVYHLNGEFAVFATDIGLNDSATHNPPNPPPAVVFEVYLDGALLFRSDDMDSDSLTQSLEFGVQGGQILELVADRGSDGSTWEDQADWAGARVYPTAGPDTVAPVVTAITPGTAVQNQVTQLSLVAYDNLSAPSRCTVEWDLDNDGQFDDATGLSISHVFTRLGAATIGVQMTDEENNVSTSSTTVRVEASTTALPPVPTDMLAHWKLDETAGTTAIDEMGSFDGTVIGGTSINQAGIVDKAYAVDGINGAVSAPAMNVNSNTMTMVAWLNLDEIQSDWAGVFMCRGGNTVAGINLRNTRELRYHWDKGQWTWGSGLYVPHDTWVLVALAVEANKATMFMRASDGFHSSVNTATHGIQLFDTNTYLGRDPGSSTRYMKGAIDDVRLYKRTLSADEIEAMYQEVMQGRLALSATAGPGGSISPSSQVVSPNASQTFSITPDAGYEIFDVLVDGSSVGAQSSYRFNNVTRHHFIDARFQKLPSTTNWTITATAGTGGTITPNGAQAVPEGNLHVVNITPNVGYRILDVTVDGQSVGARASYAFSQVAQAHSIQASFEATTQWALTASVQGGNGSVTPVSASVYDGGSQTFTFTPASGYQVADVLVDGASFGASDAYSLANITTNHTIAVSFEKAPVRVLDSDGDGWIDTLETQLGTDPHDLDSFFKIMRITPRSATGKVELTWPSASGVQYRVLTSPDLTNWSEARGWSNATATPEELYELNQSPSNSFFKVEAQLP